MKEALGKLSFCPSFNFKSKREADFEWSLCTKRFGSTAALNWSKLREKHKARETENTQKTRAKREKRPNLRTVSNMLQEMTDTASNEESDLEETLSAAAKCSITSSDNLIIICVFLKKDATVKL